MVKPTTNIAEAIAQDYAAGVEEADDLLREIKLADREATYDEYVYFRQRLGWEQNEVREQLRRMHSVLRLQAIAGTTEDRNASIAERDKSKKLLDTEGPKLQKQIEELTATLKRLESDATRSAKRVEDQQQAIEDLRKHVPQHVLKRVNTDVGLVSTTIGKELNDAKIRQNEIECCLTPRRYPSENAYLQMLQHSNRAAVTETSHNRVIQRTLSPAWPTIREANGKGAC